MAPIAAAPSAAANDAIGSLEGQLAEAAAYGRRAGSRLLAARSELGLGRLDAVAATTDDAGNGAGEGTEQPEDNGRSDN